MGRPKHLWKVDGLTVLGAANTVQRPRGDGDDFLPLKPLDLPGPPHVVVRAMAQPMVVPFSPFSRTQTQDQVQSRNNTTTGTKQVCMQQMSYTPRVDGSRFSERHRELRAALHFHHSQAGERVNLRVEHH